MFGTVAIFAEIRVHRMRIVRADNYERNYAKRMRIVPYAVTDGHTLLQYGQRIHISVFAQR